MKRIFCMILCLTLLACQPTPEEAVVTHKDTETMLQIAVTVDAPVEDMVRAPETLHISRTVESDRTQFQIVFDADVVLPPVSKIPIVRIGHGRFGTETVERIVQYIGNGSSAIEVFPKRYYQGIIDGLMALRQSGDLDKYDSVEEVDEAILEVVDEMNHAPDEPVFAAQSPLEQVRSRGFADYMGLSDRSTIFMMTVSDFAGKDNLVEYRYDERTYLDLQYYALGSNLMSEWQPLVDRGEVRLLYPNRTAESAQAFAEDLLQKLGVSDTYTCVKTRIAPLAQNGALTEELKQGCPCVWEVLFTRQVNGVNVTFTLDSQSSDVSGNWMDDASYAAPWRYEKICVYVDDEGLCGFFWWAPYEVLEITTSNASVIPLDDAVATFERYIEYRCMERERQFQTVPDTLKITVTEIRLGLVRVLEKDSSGTAYLVPAYTFFGVTEEGDAFYSRRGYGNTTALLVVNAVDGSIIDMRLGY